MRSILIAVLLLAPTLCLASWDEWEDDPGVSTWQDNAIPNPEVGTFGQNHGS